MAIIYPSIEKIQLLRQKPTEGELNLLKFLKETLDDTYEVFFQPFLNGDIPDIIIMRKESGVYIIEVKDWDLDHYKIRERGNWFVKKNNGDSIRIKSPIEQVFNYKENLYNLHIQGLLERRIKNPKNWGIVNCGVYFHNASTKHCNKFIKNHLFDDDGTIKDKWSDKHRKFLTYFDFIGFDELKSDSFKKIMKNRRMSEKSYLFDDKLYKNFKRNFIPPKHYTDQGINIIYSKNQKKIINSHELSHQKIKGVAGSGKTLCLAKRVVNSHIRHKQDVLILTFNISLKNYIHDKINEVRENFNWKHFHIVHYHQFFKTQANNYNLPITNLSDWNNSNFFDSVKEKISPYQTVVIDEIQDYNKDWIDLIQKYFLDKNHGEYVVYGDEKQNIYQRKYDEKEKKPYTKIPGQWNLLKTSYRISNDIARLAKSYQEYFFIKKYDLDEILIQRNIFEKSTLKYFLVDTLSPKELVSLYKKIANELLIHDNDICFQSSEVETLRKIDFIIRKKSGQKTNTMFETQEVYDKILDNNKLKETDIQKFKEIIQKKSKKLSVSEEDEKFINQKIKSYYKFKEEIEIVRKNKKFNFWNNRGVIKMSTIHSFKGWETDTLFLIIDEQKNDNINKKFTTEELVYTAITRCRTNLIIVNVNNQYYHDFFNSNIIDVKSG